MIKKTYTKEQAAQIAIELHEAVGEFQLDSQKTLEFYCYCMVVAEKMAQNKRFKLAFKKSAKFIEDTEVGDKIQ